MKYSTLLLIFSLIPFCFYAQSGSLDTTFNSGDFGFGFGDGFDLNVNCSVLQPDGKILVGGNFTKYNGKASSRICRLNTDGSLDTSFQSRMASGSSVNSIALQTNGKIIIGGGFLTYDGLSRNYIARINSDGSIDTTFNPGTGAGGQVQTIAIQSDGKIIIGGFFNTYNGTNRNSIARINTNGSLDATFNPGTGANNNIYSISIQSDGKIILAGDFTRYNNITSNRIVRVNSNGSLDATFNIGTGFNSRVYSTLIQPDGKIIVAGAFTSFNSLTRNCIVRLNTNGSEDLTFNAGTGIANPITNFITSVALQPNAKILVAGTFNSYNGNTRNYIMGLEFDGSIDTSFDALSLISTSVNTICLQNDGKIIVGGNFGSMSGCPRNGILRLLSNGLLDEPFYSSTGANGIVTASGIQTDGKILVGGIFTTINGILKNRITRLNIDGTIDTTFNVGTGTNSSIQSLAIQTDNKILIAGNFTNYNGTLINRLARLNVDGSLDTTFNTGSGTNN